MYNLILDIVYHTFILYLFQTISQSIIVNKPTDMNLMNSCAICGLEFDDGKALYEHVGRFMPYGGRNCLQKLGYSDINLYKAQRERIRRQMRQPTEVIHPFPIRCPAF